MRSAEFLLRRAVCLRRAPSRSATFFSPCIACGAVGDASCNVLLRLQANQHSLYGAPQGSLRLSTTSYKTYEISVCFFDAFRLFL